MDEYQDVGPEQYELISALAGRTLQDEDSRLSLFAVGDDDQNIYAFDGASVEFIRRFEADYAAKPAFLTENYRSPKHIIAAANLFIDPARYRMKAGHSITIDRARAKAPAGGDWQSLDPVGQGRGQVLPAGRDAMTQAVAVMAELQRLCSLDPNWDWARTAAIAREWKFIEPLRSFCELNGIPVQMADEDAPNFWRLRETQALVDWLRTQEIRLVDSAALAGWLDGQAGGPWWELLREAADEYALETGGAELPIEHFVEWLAEWGREVRRRQTGLLLLTAHRAKGLEFDHVAVLDGGWDRVGSNEDLDAPRRLYYVAMTRARKSLTLARFDRHHGLLDALPKCPGILRRGAMHLPRPAPELARHYQRLTPREIDLGFAGRHPPASTVHQAIAALAPGEPLQLRERGGRWELVDGRGTTVGRLARAFAQPPGTACIMARVVAVIVWRREDSEDAYRDQVRCDRWEVVVPELVFAAATSVESACQQK